MENILLGLQSLLAPLPLIGLFIGSLIGLVVGSLPGLNDSITMAVLIPITFGMDPKLALCLLIGIYCSSATGGSIPAILLTIPGTASAMVTTLDGYPMAEKGEGKKALKFGPPEYFMLAVIGMSNQTGISRFTFGNPYLLDGISLVPMLLGLFGITSVLELVELLSKNIEIEEFKKEF
jgi:putative tricarboxylic transport membrane protein